MRKPRSWKNRFVMVPSILEIIWRKNISDFKILNKPEIWKRIWSQDLNQRNLSLKMVIKSWRKMKTWKKWVQKSKMASIKLIRQLKVMRNFRNFCCFLEPNCITSLSNLVFQKMSRKKKKKNLKIKEKKKRKRML